MNEEPTPAEINQVVALFNAGHHAKMEGQTRLLIERYPNSGLVWKMLGVFLQALGKDGIPALQKATELSPDDAEAHYNLACAMKEIGRLDDTFAHCRRALEIKPDYAEAHNTLANTLADMGHLAEAEASFRRALEIKPDYADAHNDMGNALRIIGRLDDAVASCRRALAINPDCVEAYNNLGVTLMELSLFDEAEACYRQTLRIKPDFRAAFSNLLFTLNYHPDLSAEEIFRVYQEYDALFGIPLRSTWRTHTNDKTPNRRLRIGYVSPDFRNHPMRHFLEPLLSCHDKSQIEVFAYAELNKEDELTARYKSYVEHWIPTKGMGDEALAERIRSDGIDILVDLAGHTVGNRLSVFARKPAPVSLSMMGFGYTTGLSAIDYFLIDAAAAPEGSEGLFSEQPWRIATPAFPYRPAAGMGEVSELPALQNGYITFGTLSRSVRINHRTIRVWAALLNAVPNSRLVMDSLNFKNAAMQERMASKFTELGIHRDRLEFGLHSPPWDVLRSIDISLDCFPHNSGTTLFESLYMGVPFITLAGRPSVGRLGSSLLQGTGHPEWIAVSEAEYVTKAVELASDLERLAKYRAALRGEIERSEIFVEAIFVHKMEEAYKQMWQRWCAGLPEEISEVKLTDNMKINPSLPLTTEQDLDQAVAFQHTGKLQEAEERYRFILKTLPNHPEANHNMGVLAVQKNQPANALPYFLAALDADPTRAQYWISYIDALFQAGQSEDARQVLALAQQQGLEGDEVDSLVLRLQGGTQTAELLNSADDTLLIPSTVSKDNPKKPKAKPATNRKKNPDNQEINTLAALFAKGRYVEAAPLAQSMTERYPLHGFGWKALGAVLRQMGRNADALMPMQKAAELSPNDAESHHNLGNAFQDLGRLSDAEISYRRAIRIKPDYAEAHCSLGNTLKNMGMMEEAEVSYRRAIQIKPDYAVAHNNLGVILMEQGRLIDACDSYRRALQINPDYADAHNNLGNTLKDMGQLDEACASFLLALQIKPDYSEAYNNLGITLQKSGRSEEAEASYKQALRIKPDDAGAHSNLGVTLQDMGRLDEACASYRRALQIMPDLADAHSNFGNILQDMGRPDEAEASYRRALQIKPDYAEAHSNLGNALKDLGRLNEAEASHRLALQIKPDYVEAHSNLGVVLQDAGRLDEACASYRQALQIRPDFAEAHNNLGLTLQNLGQFDDAVTSFRRVLKIKPDSHTAYNNLLFTLNYHPDLSAEEIYRAYQEYDALFGIPLRSTWRTHSNDKTPNRRRRVGYVSPDFRSHSMRHFLEPLLSCHDKSQIEVFAYAELNKEDELTARYKSYVEHWIPTKGMGDEALAERIRSDGIDILVDLAGHSLGNRLSVFARKPAPVSLSMMGFGYTTGLSAIDYFLIDAAAVPEGSEGLFSEQPWRIATPAFPYRPAAGMGAVSELPALQNGYITFGTLSRSVRINHRTIRVWAALLNAVPNSRLVMDSLNFKDPAMQEHMVTSFAEYGITRERLEFGYHSPPWGVLRSIDISLDCFPHNSGTTLIESLYMGVPFITLAGRPSVGRIGSAILQGAGHPEWIAVSEAEYVTRAVELASDLERLAKYRASLRGEMERSEMFVEADFVRKMEEAYRKMWQIWCKKNA